MTTLFDPDRRDGITSHEASIVSGLARTVQFDEAVVLTKSSRENSNLTAGLAQFGSARLSMFHVKQTMTLTSLRLLALKLLGLSGMKFPSHSSIILVGYHWVFWLPFLRAEKNIIFIPFDCWSAREIRVAGDENSRLGKYGRHVFGLVIRAFEHSSAKYVDLFGFVSREEIDKYVERLDPELRARVLSRAAVVPIAEYHNTETTCEILSRDVPKVLIWMDGRVSYGVKSIVAAAHAVDKWIRSERRKNVAVTLLTRKSDTELRDILPPGSDWHNVEFIKDALASFLGSFDVIILPDINGSGLKNRTLQSIASGASVIATQIAAEGLNEALRNAIHVVQNLDELGDALDGIFSDVEGARNMAQAARVLLSLENQETGERGKFYQRVALSTAPI